MLRFDNRGYLSNSGKLRGENFKTGAVECEMLAAELEFESDIDVAVIVVYSSIIMCKGKTLFSICIATQTLTISITGSCSRKVSV